MRLFASRIPVSEPVNSSESDMPKFIFFQTFETTWSSEFEADTLEEAVEMFEEQDEWQTCEQEDFQPDIKVFSPGWTSDRIV